MLRFKGFPVLVLLAVVSVSLWMSGCGGTNAEEMDASDQYVTRVDTPQEFAAEVLAADKPVLVDFYATWCPPCQALAPRIHRIARDYEGRVKFIKVNVDKSPQLASQYGVKGYPTVIIFNQGKMATKPLAGLLGESTYREALDKVIALDAGKE